MSASIDKDLSMKVLGDSLLGDDYLLTLWYLASSITIRHAEKLSKNSLTATLITELSPFKLSIVEEF